jgi:hypothetical protein
MAVLLTMVLVLVAAAVAKQQAVWPAGVAAVLLFAPYFIHARL